MFASLRAPFKPEFLETGSRRSKRAAQWPVWKRRRSGSCGDPPWGQVGEFFTTRNQLGPRNQEWNQNHSEWEDRLVKPTNLWHGFLYGGIIDIELEDWNIICLKTSYGTKVPFEKRKSQSWFAIGEYFVFRQTKLCQVRMVENCYSYQQGTEFFHVLRYTLWLLNIAMENGSFIDDFPS